jgi:hypothetical protein
VLQGEGMKFHRTGEWFELSECGQYTVSAAKVNDKFVFSAHRVGKPGECLGSYLTPSEAREHCREHARLADPIP